MQINPASVRLGSDPEGFFQKNGLIVGSEKVLPETGISVYPNKIVKDGVQFEFNIGPGAQLSTVKANVQTLMVTLMKFLYGYPGITPCWDGVVEVTREELDSLSPASRVLGCQPSKNYYGDRPITVDVNTYRKRSAGGHIHFDLRQTMIMAQSRLVDYRHDTLPYFDIFIGNTMVLIDRDPGAAERRENYGRAGEYRLPDYGVEYRTLSNFWLWHPVLTDLVFGTAHLAASVYNDTFAKGGDSMDKDLIDVVDLGLFVKAIETNNWELARNNFETIVPFINKYVNNQVFPINNTNVGKFLTFAEGVRNDGLTRFFPEDPFSNWSKPKLGTFNEFIQTI